MDYIPLTPELRAALLAALRDGHSRGGAARKAGVSKWKLHAWMKDPELNLRADVLKAEAESTSTLISLVKNHAEEDWRAAAWLLERRDPDWQSPADKLKARELERPQQAPIQINVAQQAALQARLAEYEPLQLPSHATSTQVQEPENEHDDDTQDPIDPEPE